MSVYFNSSMQAVSSFFQKKVLPFVSLHHKKIIAIATVAFACLAALYLINRYRNKKLVAVDMTSKIPASSSPIIQNQSSNEVTPSINALNSQDEQKKSSPLEETKSNFEQTAESTLNDIEQDEPELDGQKKILVQANASEEHVNKSYSKAIKQIEDIFNQFYKNAQYYQLNFKKLYARCELQQEILKNSNVLSSPTTTEEKMEEELEENKSFQQILISFTDNLFEAAKINIEMVKVIEKFRSINQDVKEIKQHSCDDESIDDEIDIMQVDFELGQIDILINECTIEEILSLALESLNEVKAKKIDTSKNRESCLERLISSYDQTLKYCHHMISSISENKLHSSDQEIQQFHDDMVKYSNLISDDLDNCYQYFKLKYASKISDIKLDINDELAEVDQETIAESLECLKYMIGFRELKNYIGCERVLKYLRIKQSLEEIEQLLQPLNIEYNKEQISKVNQIIEKEKLKIIIKMCALLGTCIDAIIKE